MFIPIIEPTDPVNSNNKYVRISLNVNGFFVMRDNIKDRIMYKDENFIPSRYAFDLVFLPRIIDDIRIDIIGIKQRIIV